MRYAVNKTKYLLEPEIQALFATLGKMREKYPRDVLLIELGLKLGARAQEILNIKVSDLNLHDETILIHGLKGSSDREIPIPPELFKRLVKYTHPGKDRIFDLRYNRFRDIWVQYRPVKKKLHSLRHTFAIELFKKTKDLRLVQIALGHRNITNTMVYADYIYSQNELKKLIL